MSAVLQQVDAQFPAKLEPLFTNARYKVAHSGRGAGKSWGFARALIIKALQKPIRVLCAREKMTSIRDSVHKLLGDQCEHLGVAIHFQIGQAKITCSNG